ncbi:hypothetical protein B0H14DRAFT_2833667 [Mycena olivaceomarginata]|nr:hypothetical protein B0H14DRAFT_2833667 [Mycena olivaceomarginata]
MATPVPNAPKADPSNETRNIQVEKGDSLKRTRQPEDDGGVEGVEKRCKDEPELPDLASGLDEHSSPNQRSAPSDQKDSVMLIINKARTDLGRILDVAPAVPDLGSDEQTNPNQLSAPSDLKDRAMLILDMAQTTLARLWDVTPAVSDERDVNRDIDAAQKCLSAAPAESESK